MGKPIATVQLGVARLGIEIMDRRTDAELAEWVRAFHRALSLQDPSINEYAAELLIDVEAFRKAESERKKHKPSSGFQRIPEDSNGFRNLVTDSEHSQSVSQSARQTESKLVSTKPKKHAFERSPLFERQAFRERFPAWSPEKCREWHTRAIEYSGANGGRYVDWGLAIQAWERKQEAEGPRRGYANVQPINSHIKKLGT